MSDEIEYIEPTQEHVGQMVDVKDSEFGLWVKAKLTGILDDDFRFAARSNGEVCSVGRKFARIPRPLTYAERQARCGLKVGDRVRIMRAFTDNEGGSICTFMKLMREQIGLTSEIECIHEQWIQLKGSYFAWPYFVLEKVEDRVATHLDIGAKVYVTGSPEDEFELTHVYRDVGELNINDTFAIVRRGDKRFVYELSNLRVKE